MLTLAGALTPLGHFRYVVTVVEVHRELRIFGVFGAEGPHSGHTLCLLSALRRQTLNLHGVLFSLAVHLRVTLANSSNTVQEGPAVATPGSHLTQQFSPSRRGGGLMKRTVLRLRRAAVQFARCRLSAF